MATYPSAASTGRIVTMVLSSAVIAIMAFSVVVAIVVFSIVIAALSTVIAIAAFSVAIITTFAVKVCLMLHSKKATPRLLFMVEPRRVGMEVYGGATQSGAWKFII